MSAETWSERKERERQNSAINDLAWEVAQHTAQASMVRVERQEDRSWPTYRFTAYPETVRCTCGQPMIPLPEFSKRHGMLPCWFCATCNLRGVVEACEAIRAAVREIA